MTQELVYRVFFFHRYAPALNGESWLAIAVNAALFATMHAIIFASRGSSFHWEAVMISFIGGLIFAYRYTRTRSFLAVWLEHALYGDLIFTVGLGRFFFRRSGKFIAHQVDYEGEGEPRAPPGNLFRICQQISGERLGRGQGLRPPNSQAPKRICKY